MAIITYTTWDQDAGTGTQPYLSTECYHHTVDNRPICRIWCNTQNLEAAVDPEHRATGLHKDTVNIDNPLPAAGTAMTLNFQGCDDAGNAEVYGNIVTCVQSGATAAECGRMDFQIVDGGALTTKMCLVESTLWTDVACSTVAICTPNVVATTLSGELTGNSSTATNVAASGLTGATLAAGVTGSSLTSIGTLTAGGISTAPTATSDIAPKCYVDNQLASAGGTGQAVCLTAAVGSWTVPSGVDWIWLTMFPGGAGGGAGGNNTAGYAGGGAGGGGGSALAMDNFQVFLRGCTSVSYCAGSGGSGGSASGSNPGNNGAQGNASCFEPYCLEPTQGIGLGGCACTGGGGGTGSSTNAFSRGWGDSGTPTLTGQANGASTAGCGAAGNAGATAQTFFMEHHQGGSGGGGGGAVCCNGNAAGAGGGGGSGNHVLGFGAGNVALAGAGGPARSLCGGGGGGGGGGGTWLSPRDNAAGTGGAGGDCATPSSGGAAGTWGSGGGGGGGGASAGSGGSGGTGGNGAIIIKYIG